MTLAEFMYAREISLMLSYAANQVETDGDHINIDSDTFVFV